MKEDDIFTQRCHCFIPYIMSSNISEENLLDEKAAERKCEERERIGFKK